MSGNWSSKFYSRFGNVCKIEILMMGLNVLQLYVYRFHRRIGKNLMVNVHNMHVQIIGKVAFSTDLRLWDCRKFFTISGLVTRYCIIDPSLCRWTDNSSCIILLVMLE